MRKVLFAASECDPFIKTGGLGNVIGQLPRYLNKKIFDVRIIIPAYECMDQHWKDQMETVLHYPVRIGDEVKSVTLKTLVYEGITCYFLGQPDIFGGDSPYADMWADTGKFIFFSRAVLELLAYIDFIPDIIHCHDWQVGLIPPMLRTLYQNDPFYNKIKTVMTIHNLRFQGICDLDYVRYATNMPDEAFTYDKLEYYGRGNMLKGGLAYADQITTVSESYAREIQTSLYGEGLEGLLQYRKDKLTGIVNGIDYHIYTPTRDEYIRTHYNTCTFASGKRKNKAQVQEMMGLPEKEDAFLIGMISRLTDQKGFDLLASCVDELCQTNIQFVVLGGGEKKYEDMFSDLARKYPDHFAVNFNYNDRLAKYIYAGSDASLMPSRFEPCGLSQLMALRYGSVPIVRQTGGLIDTVALYDAQEQTGTGFGFVPYDANALKETVLDALHVYETDPDSWNALVARGMKEDFSWKSSAKKYEKMYKNI